MTTLAEYVEEDAPVADAAAEGGLSVLEVRDVARGGSLRMPAMAASMRAKSTSGSLSSCFGALWARLALQACGALGSVLLVGDRVTGCRLGSAAFDGAEFRGCRRRLRHGLFSELLRPNDDGAAVGRELNEVAKHQPDPFAHGYGNVQLVIAGEAGNCGGIGHGEGVP
jgi:hypothetical protein